MNRPELTDVFTPRRKGNMTPRFNALDFAPYSDGVEVAHVPARFIDNESAGIAGWIARTSPKRRSGQEDPVRWIGRERVYLAPDKKVAEVYHVGVGGPLFATRAEAGEAARLWRYGLSANERNAQVALIRL